MSWNCGCDALDVIWSNCQKWKLWSKLPYWDGISNKSKFDHRVSKPSQPQFSHMQVCAVMAKKRVDNGANSILGRRLQSGVPVIGVRAAPSLVPASGVRRGSRDGVWGWWWGGWVRCRSLSSVVRRGYDDSKNSKNFTLT